MDIREAVEKLFEYEEMGNRRFSKETYAPSFEKFEEIAKGFDEALYAIYDGVMKSGVPKCRRGFGGICQGKGRRRPFKRKKGREAGLTQCFYGNLCTAPYYGNEESLLQGTG